MNRRTINRVLCIAGLACASFAQAGVGLAETGLTLTASAVTTQQEFSPRQKLMAKRAAQADAYRQLAEQILGLQINATTFVRDFATESDKIQASIDEFIKGVRFGRTTHFSDGSAEVEAEVTIRQVIRTLQQIREENPNATGGVDVRDFERISTTSEDTVIMVIGSGAVRAESEVPDPVDQSFVPGVISPSRVNVQISLPDCWREYSAQERLKAKRAAQLDAYRLLVERLYGLQLNATTSVEEFVTSSDRIRTQTQGFLRGAKVTATRYSPDCVVEVEMQLTIKEVIKRLQQIREENPNASGGVDVRDFERLNTETVRKVLTVLGTGAPDDGTSGGTRRTEKTTIIEESTIMVVE